MFYGVDEFSDVDDSFFAGGEAGGEGGKIVYGIVGCSCSFIGVFIVSFNLGNFFF